MDGVGESLDAGTLANIRIPYRPIFLESYRPIDFGADGIGLSSFKFFSSGLRA